ncbi:MAG: hypothetical protein IPH88_17845 [Bacteroidales bacterium]|nr:hypothetical protein [Bacteroidales bacterium]
MNIQWLFDYSVKKITPLGGMQIIMEFYDRIGLYDKMRELPFYESGSGIGFDHHEVLESFMMSVILGVANFISSSRISYDEVLKGH